MLKEQMKDHGNKMFRWRGQLPFLILFMLPLAFPAMIHQSVFHAHLEEALETFGLLLAICGQIMRILCVGYAAPATSGRNTTTQRAETLNVSGMYSIIRHPLYVANYFIFAGLNFMVAVWWFPLVSTLIYFLYYERIIMAEENFLENKFGDTYTEWAAKTPCVIPNIRLWKKSARSFNLKRVLRAEYPSIMLIGIVYMVIEAIEKYLTHKSDFEYFPFFIGLFFCTISAILFFLKKFTRLLKE